MLIILNIFLIILASIADAVQDTLTSHYSTSIFKNVLKWKIFKNKTKQKQLKIYKWFDPDYSWRNKYKEGIVSKGEKFKGSTSIFVFVTDCWHFSQFIQLNALFLFAVSFSYYNQNKSFIEIILSLIIARIIYGLNFTYWYNKKLKI